MRRKDNKEQRVRWREVVREEIEGDYTRWNQVGDREEIKGHDGYYNSQSTREKSSYILSYKYKQSILYCTTTLSHYM